MSIIEWDDFTRINLRVGTIIHAEPNTNAKKPTLILDSDPGELGVKRSSAQITQHYAPETRPGRRVLCVCNVEPKRVAGIKSEVLVTGTHNKDGNVVLAEFTLPVPNGTRLA